MIQLTRDQKDFLDYVCRSTWYLNSETGLIDVAENVLLDYRFLTKIPYKFGKINGNFDCSRSGLTTLEGCPIEVKGGFFCHNNKLTSLKYCPEIVNSNFWCSGNQLQSSKYLPKMILNYDDCIKEINRQKRNYLIDLGFDPDDKEYFQELMDELEKS